MRKGRPKDLHNRENRKITIRPSIHSGYLIRIIRSKNPDFNLSAFFDKALILHFGKEFEDDYAKYEIGELYTLIKDLEEKYNDKIKIRNQKLSNI